MPPRYMIHARGSLLYRYCPVTHSRCTGTKPLINPEQARFMGVPAAYSSTRAIAELGYAPVPLAQSVQEAHAWYRAEGLM